MNKGGKSPWCRVGHRAQGDWVLGGEEGPGWKEKTRAKIQGEADGVVVVAVVASGLLAATGEAAPPSPASRNGGMGSR